MAEVAFQAQMLLAEPVLGTAGGTEAPGSGPSEDLELLAPVRGGGGGYRKAWNHITKAGGQGRTSGFTRSNGSAFTKSGI